MQAVLTEIGTGRPLREIATALNERNVPTERGGRWHATSVARLLRHIGWPAGLDVHLGDCREVLQTLATGSMHCCITSPPYWQARDYGIDQQIGREKTAEDYLTALVHIFRQVRRTLRDDGTLWIVIGDSYDEKDRRLLPARLALHLQGDGWILRDEIIWHKPRTTPAPVTDRTVAAHEIVYMLTKRPSGYYYDYEAIEEPAITAGAIRTYRANMQKNVGGVPLAPGAKPGTITVRKTRRKRSVWSISPQQSAIPHFAMFPSSLAATCLLAGCPPGGTVLDPFAGAGTTGLVALRHGRRACLIEVSETYASIARKRLFEEVR